MKILKRKGKEKKLWKLLERTALSNTTFCSDANATSAIQYSAIAGIT